MSPLRAAEVVERGWRRDCVGCLASYTNVVKLLVVVNHQGFAVVLDVELSRDAHVLILCLVHDLYQTSNI